MIRALRRWYIKRRFLRALDMAELAIKEQEARRRHKAVKHIQKERTRRVLEALR